MNIYYDFETDVPEQQLRPLIDFFANTATQGEDLGTHFLTKDGPFEGRWHFSFEIWDSDGFNEEMWIDRQTYDENLAESWLVLLEGDRGNRKILDDMAESDVCVEFWEVLTHLLKPGTKAYSYGDGPNGFIFTSKDYAHVPLSHALESYDPAEISNKNTASKLQLSLSL